ncbi:MAG TPA: O-antigen ligase family protein [Candidatus Saccharimonadales bacterium]|jgi:putative inorganic carbon (HCO3(-)) transporter|nr:O-antigen ligase family protein [Candidatus Saccharimonadales bacterium]
MTLPFHPVLMFFAGGGITPIAIYCGAIVVFLLSIFWRPQVGVYFLVPLLPLQTVRYLLHPLPFGEKLVDFVLLGVILGLLIHRKGRVFPQTPLNVFLVVWAVFHYVSLWRGALFLGVDLPWWVSDPRFSNWKNYMIMPLLFMTVAAAIKEKGQMQILMALMAVSVLRNNLGFYNTVSERDFTHFSYGLRYAGTLGYAGENGLAAFEAQTALFCIGLMPFIRRKAVKIAMLGFVVSCLYCLLFAFSRGGYLGFLAGLLFLGVLYERKLLVLFLGLVLSWQALVPKAVSERIFMTYEDGQIDSSAGERVTIWQDALTLIEQRPIFGSGFDTYEFMNRVDEFRDTHNIYLKVLVEMGVLGLLLFLALLLKSLGVGYRLFRAAEDPVFRGIGLGLAAVMVCTLVVNLFGDRWMYLQVTGYTFALLGLAVRAQIITNEARDASAESEEQPAQPVVLEPVGV